MPNLAWVAEVVFFGSYFIAWMSNEIAHTTWLNVSAICALILAVALLLFNGYGYYRNQPHA
jgi:hypothetical protein